MLHFLTHLGANSFGVDRTKQQRFSPYPPPSVPAPSQVGDDEGEGEGDGEGNGDTFEQ